MPCCPSVAHTSPLCHFVYCAQATTPMDPRVVDAMLPFMTEQYGNPHSRTHLYGWEAEEAVEVARGQVSGVWLFVFVFNLLRCWLLVQTHRLLLWHC